MGVWNHKAVTFPRRPDVLPACRRIYHVEWDTRPDKWYWTHVSFWENGVRHTCTMKGNIDHDKAVEIAVAYWRREKGFLFLAV
jgi:hypothetical protein